MAIKKYDMDLVATHKLVKSIKKIELNPGEGRGGEPYSISLQIRMGVEHGHRNTL